MVSIKAFNGISYNKEIIGDFSKVISPPYDVISKQKQQKLYDLHENNFVRIDFGKKKTTDNDTDNMYTRANEFFNEWLEKEILKQEKKPCIYIYKQIFKIPGTELVKSRIGFVAALKLQEFSDEGVSPHEITFSSPKEDRYKLMSTTGTVTGQIFTIFPDSDNKVGDLINSRTGDNPFIKANMDDIEHIIWKIDDEEWISKLCDNMAKKNVIIADGHHRYETGLMYANKNKDVSPYIMTTFVSMDDPGLIIFPIHRLIKNSMDVESVKEKLSNFFVIEESNNIDVDVALKDLKKMLDDGLTVFWMKSKGGKAFWLKLKPDVDIMKFGEKEHSVKWNNLDVSVFQSLILKKVFSFSDSSIESMQGIDCPKDPKEAYSTLENDDDYDYLFLLNPVDMKELKDVVNGGERMPQKSTNFHPKVYSGLTFQKIK